MLYYRYLALGIVNEHTIDSPMVSWEDPFLPYDVNTLGITALQVNTFRISFSYFSLVKLNGLHKIVIV